MVSLAEVHDPALVVVAGSWRRVRRSVGGVGSGTESRVIVLWASTLQVEGAFGLLESGSGVLSV